MTPSPGERAWLRGDRGAFFGAILGVLAIGCGLAVHALRLKREGVIAVAASDDALARKERLLAIAYAKHAAETVPFQTSDEGFSRLEAMAEEAEVRSDDRTSLTAWRAFRSAAIAARRPNEMREKAERKLAERGARLMEKERSFGEARVTETFLRQELVHDALPSASSSVLMGAGAVLFLGGAASLLGAATPRLGRTSLALVGAGTVLCVLGAALP